MPANAEEIAKEGELQILLNIFGENLIEATYPFTNTPILKARSEGEGYRITLECSKETFGKIQRPVGPLADELPAFNDIFECLTSNGILPFTNQKEAISRMNMLRSLRKKVFFCLDTNLLYQRFASNSRALDPRDAIIVDIVLNEVECQLNYKYKPDQIYALKEAVPYNKMLMDEFSNKKMKTSRKAAYFAKNELKRVRDGGALIVESQEKSTDDKEANDRFIVHALKQVEKERGVYPVMLTADNAITGICDLEGIEYVYLKLPNEAAELRATPAQMRALLFSLAAILGAVRVNSVVLFSEYRGKETLEEMKLSFLNNETMDEFKRGVGICRRLMALGIEH